MTAKFVINKDKRGEFRFTLEASNGEVIVKSEGYKTIADVYDGIESVKKNSKEAIEIQEDISLVESAPTINNKCIYLDVVDFT